MSLWNEIDEAIGYKDDPLIQVKRESKAALAWQAPPKRKSSKPVVISATDLHRQAFTKATR